jgi:hypothetical protein
MANVYPILEYADQTRPVRGIGWLLKWTAAICVLSTSAVILLSFAYRLATEQALSEAAMAGLRAAALPRATSRSVEQSIHRELGNYLRSDRGVSVSLQSAGKPVKGAINRRLSGQLSVTLSAPLAVSLPSWLSALSPWSRDTLLVAKVDDAQ